jgi:NAD+ synthase (glutamine-hydrolysing)
VTAPLRIALAQINATVGDLSGNAGRIADFTARARDEGARLVLFPELALTGYPPEDLLIKDHFLTDTGRALEELAAGTQGIVALVGFPERATDVHNALAVLADGRVQGVYRKVYLPNYGVFDEQRYFAPGERGALIELDGVRIGLTVCEDVWEPGPPATDEALAGATLVLNASASPYHAGKGAERERMLVQRAIDSSAAVAYCNLVGGQDELIFDGGSVVIEADGTILARAPQFEEDLLLCTVDPGEARAVRLRDTRHRPAAQRARESVDVVAELHTGHEGDEVPAEADGKVTPLLGREEEVYRALELGLRDYVDKNGFEHVTLGVSGGIDSALVLCLAADALGPDRVTGCVMPSPFSSDATQNDARGLCDDLGVERYEFDIAPIMRGYEQTLAEVFAGREPDIAEENLQARIRGTLLMAVSNKFNWLVLTTGNKSETSVGYSTLYGDTAGGYAVIKDVPKTLVYELSRWRGIRESIVGRVPTAELRAEQRDEDSLPPYSRLDAILAAYVEQDLDRDGIVRRGYDRDEVNEVLRMTDRAEYKRRQSPPGARISTKAFGRDRRMPITNRYRPRSNGSAPS